MNKQIKYFFANAGIKDIKKALTLLERMSKKSKKYSKIYKQYGGSKFTFEQLGAILGNILIENTNKTLPNGLNKVKNMNLYRKYHKYGKMTDQIIKNDKIIPSAIKTPRNKLLFLLIKFNKKKNSGNNVDIDYGYFLNDMLNNYYKLLALTKFEDTSPIVEAAEIINTYRNILNTFKGSNGKLMTFNKQLEMISSKYKNNDRKKTLVNGYKKLRDNQRELEYERFKFKLNNLKKNEMSENNKKEYLALKREKLGLPPLDQNNSMSRNINRLNISNNGASAGAGTGTGIDIGPNTGYENFL